MSRVAASSRMAWVGLQDEALQLGLEVEAGLPLDQVVDQPHGQAAGGQPDPVVAVAVDDVVPAAPAGAAGLAPPLLAPGLPLQLQGDVLGHVPQPGALAQPLHEPAPAPDPAGVVDQAGQQLQQVVGEGGERVRGVVLERAEVDQQVDGLVVGPVVGSPVDAGLQDLEIWPGAARLGAVRPGAVDSRSRRFPAGAVDARSPLLPAGAVDSRSPLLPTSATLPVGGPLIDGRGRRAGAGQVLAHPDASCSSPPRARRPAGCPAGQSSATSCRACRLGVATAWSRGSRTRAPRSKR